MPTWVQLWVALILMPANLVPLVFLDLPYAGWIAALSVGGMAANMPTLFRERGFSKAMALPHVVIWTPLVVLLTWLLLAGQLGGGAWTGSLAALLAIDLISLGFDYPDARKWWAGDREIA